MRFNIQKIILKIVLMLFLASSNCYAAKPKILTSTAAVAGIIAMLTKDSAQIEIVQQGTGCPHHYQLRPSDMGKIKGADMLIYIDDNFDSFCSKIAQDFTGKIINISKIEGFDFQSSSGCDNFHFWPDLQKTRQVLDHLAQELPKSFPRLKSDIEVNHAAAKIKLALLQKEKDQYINNLGKIVVMSHALEHFFPDDKKIIGFYQRKNESLKRLEELKQVMQDDSIKYIVIDSNQNSKRYKQYNKKIIIINAENWQAEGPNGLKYLFYDNFLRVLSLPEVEKK